MKILCALLTLIATVNAAYAGLSCGQIGAVRDEDGNFTYFSEVETNYPTKREQYAMIRDAVSDYYGECGETLNDDFCYDPSMTNAEVDELGEGVVFEPVATPVGEIYYSVNVGFGGGNSANYYFNAETLAKEEVMIIDGADCMPIRSILGNE